jgi:cell wall-associated NlpC family hydrolase
MKILTFILFILFSELTSAGCTTPAPCIETDTSNEHSFSPKMKEFIKEEPPESLSPQESLDLITFAKGFLGTPYRYGGTSENGIDCSSFVQQVFKEFEISLPRTSREQYEDTRLLGISEDELAPNDLLFFKSSKGTTIDHVAIYMGDGKMIHSSKSENGVQVTDIKFSTFWSKRFFAAKRLNINKESL